MKLAIVFSWLNQYGGAERVLEVVHDMYPQAPIYTSVYLPSALPERYRAWDIRTSFMDRVPMARRKQQWFLPLYPLAFESFDLRGYDLVLSIPSGFAHGVLTTGRTRHICYCLTPARFLWNYHAYIEREGMGRLGQALMAPALRDLRQWDLAAAARVDRFVAISRTVRERIAKHYRREADIIYPPVETHLVGVDDAPVGEYYLVASRLVPYKRIDLAVRAFTDLGLPLKVVGDGRDRQALQKLAGPSVEFLGFIRDDAEVRRLMAGCKAFVFPGEEDFGLTPVEALSAGRPVVAYAAGGALDTVQEGRTGVLFPEATPQSLAEAVRRLEGMSFDSALLRAEAEQFSVPRFQRELDALFRQELNS
jgi:glycosyltransferase involved in cell wall biosynthesis